MKSNSESGFSLLELTVAALLTVGLLGAVFSLTNRNQQVFVTESSVVDMNQSVRTAIDLLTRDIQSAGVGLPSPMGVDVGSFAAIFYIDGQGGAPDSIMIINGDPFAPYTNVKNQNSGASELFLVVPPDVARSGSGSNEQFTYSYTEVGGTAQQKSIYKSYATDPRKYIVYDDLRARIVTLKQNGATVTVDGAEQIKLQYDPATVLSPASVFGASFDTGEPIYGNSYLTLLTNTVCYRVNTTTHELERTEDLTTWYPVARGILNFQVQYRVLLKNASGTIEERITSTPGNGTDAVASGKLTSRRDIHSAIITIEAETPGTPTTSKSYRRVVQKFEITPRNFNLSRNNNLSS